MSQFYRLINIIVLASVLLASLSLFLCPSVLTSTSGHTCAGGAADKLGSQISLLIKNANELSSCVNSRLVTTRIFNVAVTQAAWQLLAVVVIAVVIFLLFFKKRKEWQNLVQNYLKVCYGRYFKLSRPRLSVAFFRWLTLLVSHDIAFIVA